MIVVEVVARLRAVVVSLAGEGVMLWDTSIMHGFEASAKYSLQVGVIDKWVESKIINTSIMHGFEASAKYSLQELLSPDCMRDVAHLTQQRLLVEEVN